MNHDDEDIEGALAQILKACRQRKVKRNKEAYDRIEEIILSQNDERLEGDALRVNLKYKYEAAISILLLLADPPSREELDAALEKIRLATGSAVTGVRILDGSLEGYRLEDELDAPRHLDAAARDVVSFFRQRVSQKRWPVGGASSQGGGRRG